jgi:5-formyltetrahydrofolate cyclo-ligase
MHDIRAPKTSGQDMSIKRLYRRELLELRRALPTDVRAALSASLRARLLDVVRGRPGARLLAYSPLHGEPDLLPLAAALAPGCFLLPYTHAAERRLSFHAWSPGEPLVENRWGILEPRPELAEAETPRPDDVIAVPAVALSRDGHRLGYGGGFYDRFLKTAAALPVGTVYDPFLLESLPVEEHDARVAMIVTDQRTVDLA